MRAGFENQVLTSGLNHSFLEEDAFRKGDFYWDIK